MKVIYKYRLNDKNTTVSLPVGYKILHVGVQGFNSVCTWIMIDTDETAVEDVTFTLIYTGQEIPNNVTYVGTAIINELNLVFHVFVNDKN